MSFEDSDDPISDNTIKVLVRVRPLLPRETASPQECLISMPESDPTSTILRIPEDSPFNNLRSKIQNRNSRSESTEDIKKYNFDKSIWSYDKESANYVDNQTFYNSIGPSILNHFFQGFNVCLLAYGQTSSGKTFTMMGSEQELGLIPLMVRDMLRQKEILVGQRINCEIRVSYIEIYNEQVKDLLGSSKQAKCRVREHPTTGPYVENLNECQIDSYDDFTRILNQGNEQRSTAQTSMNDKSSRSHAILTLTLKQTKFTSVHEPDHEDIGDAEEEMISSIKLVDLAGSERLSKTKVYGQHERVKEGTLINKSLTVLGRCINQLANNAMNESKASLVPYRDSVLTYLLKENLGGNSKSFMIFCVSPVDFEETYQTLNYAIQVKTIRTAAKANKTKLATVPIDWSHMQASDQGAIASLKNEIQELTDKLNELTSNSHNETKFAKLMQFVESEATRVKFENKFLRSQLHQKSAQIKELNSHLDYMDHEVSTLHRDLAEMQTRALAKSRQELAEKCTDLSSQIDYCLYEFDPARAF